MPERCGFLQPPARCGLILLAPLSQATVESLLQKGILAFLGLSSQPLKVLEYRGHMAIYIKKSSFLQRKESLFIILFVITLGIFVVLSYLTQVGIQSYSALSDWMLMIILLIPLGYTLAKLFEKRSQRFSRGIWGEESVMKELLRLPHDFYIFHNLSLRHGGDIDFAVIGPTGIFAIEVKSHYRPNDRQMHAFLNQSHRAAMKLKHFIDAYCRRKVWVSALLVLPNNKRDGIEHVSDDVTLVHKHELVEYILNSQKHSVPEVEYIAAVIKDV